MTMTLTQKILFDFSPKNGTIVGAILSFIFALVTFVIAPYVLFALVSGGLADISGMIGIDVNEMAESVWPMAESMMKYAVPLVLLSIPVGFYRAGSYARVPFKMLFALYLGSWLWVASQGGIFVIDMPLEIGGSTSALAMGLDIRYIIYVMMMICFVMMFLAFSELGDKRKKYLEALEKKKDKMSKRKMRRLSDG